MTHHTPEQIAAWIEAAALDYDDGARPAFRMIELDDLDDLPITTFEAKLARRRAEWDDSLVTPIRLRLWIDGQHRLAIARERGILRLPALIWPGAKI